MESKLKLAFLLALSLIATRGAGAESNHYTTEDSLLVLWKNSAETIRKEALPAEEDPQGNWGGISYGYQLSIRFEKDTYMVGEPIIANILLRNTTPRPLECDSLGFLTDYVIFVVDGHKNGTKIWKEFRGGSLGAQLRLNPSGQYKYQIRLDEHYDFSAKGEFLIYVRRAIPKENQTSSPALRLRLEEALREYNLRADSKTPVTAGQEPVQTSTKPEPVTPSPMPEYTLVVSGNARIQVVDAPKTAGQANPANTARATSPSTITLANPGAASAVGGSQPANSRPPARAAAPKPAASPPKNILHPASKAPIHQPPAQLAQAETGGMSRRDWVFGLLVLGLVLGLGWYLFRARAPRARR